MEQPYLSAIRYHTIIMLENAWTPNELLDSIDGKSLYYYKN